MLSQILGAIGALFHRNFMTKNQKQKKTFFKCLVSIILSNDLEYRYLCIINVLFVFFIVLLGVHIHCFLYCIVFCGYTVVNSGVLFLI